jgi:hypothetical protein
MVLERPASARLLQRSSLPVYNFNNKEKVRKDLLFLLDFMPDFVCFESRRRRAIGGDRLCFRFLSVISFGRAPRRCGDAMSEAAFRIDETGRVRGADPKLHAKEIAETPDPRFCDAAPAFEAVRPPNTPPSL